ncbi:MAG: FHA domain-containing protein [Acidimicrobiaceae bacterium]|nr:FHA domain-containing protein [Acidimicrobiaceae bacterium]
MSDQVLTILKYVVLAILYLFFLRVLRAVWVELREPKTTTSPEVPDVAAPRGAPLPPYQPLPAMGGAEVTVASVPIPGARAGPVLAITDPPQQRGQRFAVNAETTVGRAPGCAVSLPDDTFVSHIHARVFRRDGGLWVEDLGSTNGTFVNGAKVTAAVPLQWGDRLQVGKTVLECTGS